MLLIITCAIALLLAFYSIIVTIALVSQKKKKKTILTTTMKSGNSINTYDYPTDATDPINITQDKTLYEKFLKLYDLKNNLQFDTISYRLGAKNSCTFGLSLGYRMVNNKFVWDSVRIHGGVDRAGGGTIKTKDGVTKDAIVSPFNFNRSELIPSHPSYGSLVILYNDEYGFCIRIAHMNPQKDIIPWTLTQLKNKKPIKQGWLIGNAGNSGQSDGAHTHTECCSIGKSSDIIEQILFTKYGDSILKEYTHDEILAYYRTRDFFKTKSEKDIFEHWNNLKLAWNITFINKYMLRRIINGKPVTYYDTWLLFIF